MPTKTGGTIEDLSPEVSSYLATKLDEKDEFEIFQELLKDGDPPDVLSTSSLPKKELSARTMMTIEEIRKEFPDFLSDMREELFPLDIDGEKCAIPAGFSYWGGSIYT
jgi:hypothetical protein